MPRTPAVSLCDGTRVEGQAPSWLPESGSTTTNIKAKIKSAFPARRTARDATVAAEKEMQARLIEEDDGRWTAIDDDSGVAGYGDTQEEAKESLRNMVFLHRAAIETARRMTREDGPYGE
jgi:hypothetical protein